MCRLSQRVWVSGYVYWMSFKLSVVVSLQEIDSQLLVDIKQYNTNNNIKIVIQIDRETSQG